MESKFSNDKLTLELSKEEALVFYEWLCRFNEGRSRLFEDQSEERVLWDIEASIEKVSIETFDVNYAETLFKAREKVRD